MADVPTTCRGRCAGLVAVADCRAARRSPGGARRWTPTSPPISARSSPSSSTCSRFPTSAPTVENIERNATHLRAMLDRHGFRAEVLRTRGNPFVYGDLPVAGATRTVLLYGHYDGQPVDAARWKQRSPFVPILRDGRLEDGGRDIPKFGTLTRFEPQWRLYARSAADDKAPIVALCAALDALKASGIAPTANVRVLIDGELESGSPSLDEVVGGTPRQARRRSPGPARRPRAPARRPDGGVRRPRRARPRAHDVWPEVRRAQRSLRQLGAEPRHSSRPPAGLDEGRRRAGAGEGLLRRHRAAPRRRGSLAALGPGRRAKPDDAVRHRRARAQGAVAAAGAPAAVVEHPRAVECLHGSRCPDDHSGHGDRGPRHPPRQRDPGPRDGREDRRPHPRPGVFHHPVGSRRRRPGPSTR